MCPTSVEVKARKVATAAAAYNTVRIHHRQHKPHELPPQLQGGSVVWVCQEIDQPVNKPTGIALRRVHAATHDDPRPLILGTIRCGMTGIAFIKVRAVKVRVGYSQDLDCIA